MAVRLAQFAGIFYSSDPDQLSAQLAELLLLTKAEHQITRAIISPQNGYVYSGMVAASAFRCLQYNCDVIKKVLLVSYSDKVSPGKLVFTNAEAFATPLGNVPVDTESVKQCLTLPNCEIDNDKHQATFSLEVQLPFLQLCLLDFTIVPVIVGENGQSILTAIIDQYLHSPEVLVIVSANVESLAHEHVQHNAAVSALLSAAHSHKLNSKIVHSGEVLDEALPAEHTQYGSSIFY